MLIDQCHHVSLRLLKRCGLNSCGHPSSQPSKPDHTLTSNFTSLQGLTQLSIVHSKQSPPAYLQTGAHRDNLILNLSPKLPNTNLVYNLYLEPAYNWYHHHNSNIPTHPRSSHNEHHWLLLRRSQWCSLCDRGYCMDEEDLLVHAVSSSDFKSGIQGEGCPPDRAILWREKTACH